MVTHDNNHHTRRENTIPLLLPQQCSGSNWPLQSSPPSSPLNPLLPLPLSLMSSMTSLASLFARYTSITFHFIIYISFHLNLLHLSPLYLSFKQRLLISVILAVVGAAFCGMVCPSSRSATQHHAAPRSTTQHHAASRSITTYHNISQYITIYHNISHTISTHFKTNEISF